MTAAVMLLNAKAGKEKKIREKKESQAEISESHPKIPSPALALPRSEAGEKKESQASRSAFKKGF